MLLSMKVLDFIFETSYLYAWSHSSMAFAITSKLVVGSKRATT